MQVGIAFQKMRLRVSIGTIFVDDYYCMEPEMAREEVHSPRKMKSPDSQCAQWARYFPVDSDGIPTSHASYRLIAQFFEDRAKSVHASDMANLLLLPRELVFIMCEQLKQIDLLLERPRFSRNYKYNLDCWNTSLQAKIESALLDFPTLAHVLMLPEVPPDRQLPRS